MVCCLHDFATLLEAGEPHHLIHSGHQPIRGGKLSLARMLSILVLFHISTDKDFKHVWHDGLTQEYRSAWDHSPVRAGL